MASVLTTAARTSSRLRTFQFRRIASRTDSILKANYSRLSRQTPTSQIVESLEQDGCVVIEKLFSSKQIAEFNKDMDAALAGVVPGKAAAMLPNSTVPKDEAVQAAIFGSNTKRLDKLVSHSPTWRELLDDDALHGICAQALRKTGDYWLSTAQAIEIGPGSGAQPWHPDGGQWSLLLGLDEKTAPELMLNFLVATTDTTKENGATSVARGSHKVPISDMVAADKLLQPAEEEIEQIELKAGDCLLLGGRIWHRGGANKTTDEHRRVLSCMVISGVLTPEEAHPLYIDPSLAKGFSERAKKFLGYKGLTQAIGVGFWKS